VDGIMVETHINPNEALSDGNQQMNREEFFDFMKKFEKFLSIF
ncbi:3-deoxy-7-phosphoheptulonate synthase, partial [bacterium]|nr:3-deoxy-7-phosphoheptulonate synthase [bacterium]